MPTLDQLFGEAARAHGIEAKNFSQPASRFVTANGLRFHYVDWGGSGVPVLFLHGGNQTARTWDLVCVQLRDVYHCYALDQRNHGESAMVPENGATPFEQREDIRGAVEALGLRDFVLIGMSLGGFNTMAYASKYPERLRAIAIVDVSPTVQPQGARQIAEFTRRREFSTFEEAVEYSARSNPRRSVAHLRYSLTFALGQRADGVWTWKHQRPFRGERDGQQLKQPAQSRAEGAADQRSALWDEVPKIPSPALIIRGGDSQILSVEDAERLARTIPRGSLVTIPGATHNVQGDKPKELAAELNRFLRKVA
jgi:pimeloyl-ACP methyl ester carboxylesterase